MVSGQVARDGYVHVRAEQCDHCLLSSARLVDAERARRIIRDTRDVDGSTFICHRGQITKEGDSICRAWFDRFADEDWILRFAKAQGLIRYTPTEGDL